MASLFSWYQFQREDANQLRFISSYDGYRVFEPGSNTMPRPRNNTTMKGISHQPSERNDAISRRLPHQWSILQSCMCHPNPPASLYKKLFPAIKEWHDRLTAKELSPDNNDPI
ncbi:hypothetical protein [Absidia glauca]|uniref:Ndc10 domain-containing protein n=1 Tax=Absidia glauca TaxID=4829 RepID=A0A168RMY3_ABSGL|nr:hypothetical protein [Absidia glauca]